MKRATTICHVVFCVLRHVEPESVHSEVLAPPRNTFEARISSPILRLYLFSTNVSGYVFRFL